MEFLRRFATTQTSKEWVTGKQQDFQKWEDPQLSFIFWGSPLWKSPSIVFFRLTTGFFQGIFHKTTIEQQALEKPGAFGGVEMP